MNVVIFGTGGHSEVILDILLENRDFNFLGFICEYSSKKKHCGYPILTSEVNLNEFKSLNIEGGIVGLGDNSRRLKVVKKIKENIPTFNFINVIANSSYISPNVTMGCGNFIEPNSTIKTGTVINDHCIINSNCSVGHHCEIKNFSSIAPGCMIGGNVKIEESAAICIGSSVKEKITIGENSVVGGLSFVNKDIPARWLCYGSPIRFVRERSLDESYFQ